MDRLKQLKLRKLQLLRDKVKLHSESNDKFIPLYDNQHRFLILKGGGGSGKSIFAGRKVLDRIVNERGHRILVCRKVAKTLRESCFQQLRGQISEHYNYEDFEVNKTDMTITHKNGNQILFSGIDDVEKLKSIYNITSIWIEEATELDEADLNQLNIRLRGTTTNYKQFIISFNPVDINHWIKNKFFNSKQNNVYISETTYKDNKFLDEEAIKVLQSFKETDPYYYNVYCLGQWGVLGKTIFDSQKISDRLFNIRDRKVKTGMFEYNKNNGVIEDSSIKFVEATDGYIEIYKDKKELIPYVIGGDTSGEGSDNFVSDIIDNTTKEQVAQLRHQLDEDLYAEQCYCLGKYYNEALIGIETNFSTYPVKQLINLGYSYQYQREAEDTFTGKLKKTYGFNTNKKTRPLLIADLVTLVRENVQLINSVHTLDEMLTFVRNEKGKPEAQQGKHDDCIMSLGIAHYISEQQFDFIEEQETKEKDPWDYEFDYEEQREDGYFD